MCLYCNIIPILTTSNMRRLWITVIGIAYSSLSGATCPKEVRIGLPDFAVPPILYGTVSLENPPGDIVNWTQNAVAVGECKPNVTIRRLPVKRLQAEMDANLLDIAPGLAPAAENLTKMIFPMRGRAVDSRLMIIRDRLSLYVLADDTTTKWDGKSLSLLRPRIGLSAGSIAGRMTATKNGWITDVARNPLGNLTKLKAHRIDAILESELLFDKYLDDEPGYRSDIRKLEPALSVVERYAPVSKQFYQKFPDYVNGFWKNMRHQALSKKQ